MSTKDAHLCVCGHPRRAHNEGRGVCFDAVDDVHPWCPCESFERKHVERNTFVSTGRAHTPKGPGPLRERGDS